MSILLKNGYVVTMDADRTIFERGFVALDSAGRISAVGPSGATPQMDFDETIDATGSIVLPGLINLHQHHWHTLLKGSAPAGGSPGKKWNGHPPATVSADDLRVSAYLCAMEMIRTGTTCCLNHSITPTGPAEVAASIEPMAELGFRQVFAKDVFLPAATGRDSDPRAVLDEIRALINTWHGARDGLVRLALAIETEPPRASGGDAEQRIAAAYYLACEKNLQISTHTSGRAIAGRSGIMHLMELGVLDRRWIQVHATEAGDTDIALMRESRCHMVYTPITEVLRGDGVGPVSKLIQRGVNCGLGTDGTSIDCSVDMVEQMKAAVFIQNAHLLDPGSMSAETALDMATINAAHALGLEADIGSLEPGKRADIAVFDMTGPQVQVMHKPISNFVCTTRGGDARTVLINGRIVLRDGKLTTRCDVEGIFKRARDAGNRLASEFGRLAGPAAPSALAAAE